MAQRTRVPRRPFRAALRAAIVLALVAVTAACGSDKASDSTASPSGASEATAAPARQGKLVIAVQPTATPDTLSANAKDLEQFLSQRLGREVEIIFPTSYAGVIEALRFGHAHAAFMSAWPLALAQKYANAEVALAEVREVVIGTENKQEPFYYSYWVV